MVSSPLRPPEIKDRQFPGDRRVTSSRPDQLDACPLGQAAEDRRHAPEHGVQPGRADGDAQVAQQANERCGVLLRPTQLCQRGSNKNTNGLVHQYLPTGIGFLGYHQGQVDAITDQINNQPCKGLGVRLPLSAHQELQLDSPHTPRSLIEPQGIALQT